uniref:Myelin basic protein n=1 Tax=Sander lucioperca TaxID=283035 RepID=A0A8C9X9N4_SANLU
AVTDSTGAEGSKKKTPGLLDQIGKFFEGDKKRKSKGSFRGALSPGPQKASAAAPRKRGAENAVVHFFRTIVSNTNNTPFIQYLGVEVSPAPPKSRVSLLYVATIQVQIYTHT